MGDAEALRTQGPMVLGQLLPEPEAMAARAAAGHPVTPRTVHLLVDTGAAVSGVGHTSRLRSA